MDRADLERGTEEEVREGEGGECCLSFSLIHVLTSGVKRQRLADGQGMKLVRPEVLV